MGFGIVPHKNPEAGRRAMRAWRQRHPDYDREKSAAYYQQNRDRILAAQRERWLTDPKFRERHRVHARKNKERYNARDRERYRNDPAVREKINARNLAAYFQRTYGITMEERAAMLAKQNNACAVCHKPFTKSSGMHLDHDHKTGKNRELLCRNCNTAIGMLYEDLTIVAGLDHYLRHHLKGAV